MSSEYFTLYVARYLTRIIQCEPNWHKDINCVGMYIAEQAHLHK